MVGKLLIRSGGGDSDTFSVVGDFVWDEREHREALVKALCAEPLVCCHGVTLGKSKLRETPHCLMRDARGTRIEHDLGDFGDLESLSFVSGVDLELPKRHHGRGLDGSGHTVRICDAEAPLELRSCLGELPDLEKLTTSGRLEDSHRPVLPIPLGCAGSPPGRLKRLVGVIKCIEDPRVKHQNQTTPSILTTTVVSAFRLENGAESSVEIEQLVLDPRLRQLKGHPTGFVRTGVGRLACLRLNCEGLLGPSCDGKTVEQGGP